MDFTMFMEKYGYKLLLVLMIVFLIVSVVLPALIGVAFYILVFGWKLGLFVVLAMLLISLILGDTLKIPTKKITVVTSTNTKHPSQQTCPRTSYWVRLSGAKF